MTASRSALTTRSRWNHRRAAACDDALAERVYTSRLLGGDPSLVLHGGGNTSVKTRARDVFGDERELLYVKGSGCDLATIDAAGFAPMRLDHLLRLAELESLSDAEMARQLRLATVDPGAPAASVEAILHAVIPYRFVDHAHPDALISVMNTPSGAERIREIYGDDVVVVPYVMPGFLLARAAARAFAKDATETTLGMALMHHGLFTFGDTAQESYERMIELVARAEEHLRAHDAWDLPAARAIAPTPAPVGLAALRHDLSRAAGRPLVVTCSGRRADLGELSQVGPATPDHVIRTKRVPMLGRDVDAYVAAYHAYFQEHAHRATAPLTMLDPAPRVVLDPELGLVTAGTSAAAAAIAADVYVHTIEMIARAELLEGWRALPAADLFDVEYWELEQAKLAQQSSERPFQGEIALVTGAASGIGRACAQRFLELGAAVVGLDLDAGVAGVADDVAYLGIEGDVTSEDSLRRALDQAVRTFGGLDMLVLNAGVFPQSSPIAALDLASWRRTMDVNLDANVALLREAFPLLRLAPNGGRVVVNASKNVPAPGPGAAAYSASKAALTQLARVAALEWGDAGIRVNVVHPNAVFDTAVWSEDVIRQRAESYGLSVEDYRRNNVLGTEVTSRGVARLVTELCGPAFAKTTGAQIPVDGGNERVI